MTKKNVQNHHVENKMKKFSVLILIVMFLGCESNSTGPDNSGKSAPTLATFSSIQQTVFSPTCASSSCHGGSRQPGLKSGQAYNNLVNKASSAVPSMLRVKPGSSASSYLMKKLNGAGVPVMPPSGKLSQATIDSIAAWIDNGALNN